MVENFGRGRGGRQTERYVAPDRQVEGGGGEGGGLTRPSRTDDQFQGGAVGYGGGYRHLGGGEIVGELDSAGLSWQMEVGVLATFRPRHQLC